VELWLSVDAAGQSATVAVEAEPATTLSELLTALAGHMGVASASALHSERIGRALDLGATIATEDLRAGDRLELRSDAAPVATARADPAIVLSVVGGPDAGRRIELRSGAYSIGRGQAANVSIDDETLSRKHFAINATADRCEVADLGSSNGTRIRSGAVTDPTPAELGDVVEAGHSLFRLDRPLDPPATVPCRDGRVQFNRPPRVHRPPGERLFRLPAPPTPAERRRLPMAAALGPLMLGLPMIFLATNQAMRIFGIVSCLGSPLLAVLSFAEDRKSGRGRFEQTRLDFHAALESLTAEMERALADEVDRRRDDSPNPADLSLAVERLTPSLWQRRANYADFLLVSPGRADQPSLSSFEIADGGHPDLRQEAEDELSRWSVARNVPVVVDLQQAGVTGLCGDRTLSVGVARSLVAQLAVTHSPRDVVLAVAVTAEEAAEWEWTMWLPHTRSETSPLQGAHLAAGNGQAAALFEAVSAVVSNRRGSDGARLAASKPLPAVVLLVSDGLDVPRSALTSLLEDGAGVSVYVVWIGTTADALPGECGAVVETTPDPSSFSLVLPNLGERIERAVLDTISNELATQIARRLAGVRDVTAGGVRGQIPRNLPLAELVGISELSPARLGERWAAAERGVRAAVGMGAGGAFVLDMRADGPHALVGGTTGAGKSELLQTFVAALALEHPPDQVTFLLVDYKGGAAFKDAVQLPHTVGFVTDLDGHLVGRVLVSLNAELHRRERLLAEHGAKDLIEMERRLPHAAPPTLILIVDEFATLAKELPEFVDGVVNVAQRGRSLGIHLILATQRPAGAINDNVRANTNLRIALRMNDESDSNDVINAKDAAHLPRTLPGRAFARTGQAELTEFQVAYVGGQAMTAATGDGPGVLVHPLAWGQVLRSKPSDTTAGADAATDLQLIVDCIGEAFQTSGRPLPERPWLPPLPEAVTTDELVAAGRDGDGVALGLLDVPSHQAQVPWSWDYRTNASLAVYGTSGSGKTTLLRTLAATLARRFSPDEAHIYGLDFASRGLGPLEHLPHVGSIVPGDDIERVQRLMTTLEREIGRRKQLFAAAGAGHFDEYNDAEPPDRLPRIFVLLDGFSGFANVFDTIDFGTWVEKWPVIVGEGRPVGIHVVITADRRLAMGMTLSSALADRVVLRMSDDDEYSSLGLDGRVAKATALPPGRGFVDDTTEVQLAVLGGARPDEQVAALREFGERLRSRHPGARVPPIGSLPSEIAFAELPVGEHLVMVLGIGQRDLAPVGANLDDGNVLVAGPNRSGRSTALATLARSLRASSPDAELYLLAPRRSPLPDLDVWNRVARGVPECEELAQELRDQLEERDGSEPQIVIFVDDGTELNDTGADSALERIVRRGRDAAMSVVGAVEAAAALRSYGGWIPEIRKDRRAFLLNPDPDVDGDLAGARLPRQQGAMPPGRGYLVADGTVQLAHAAM